MFHAESMKAGMSSYFANKKRINDANWRSSGIRLKVFTGPVLGSTSSINFSFFDFFLNRALFCTYLGVPSICPRTFGIGFPANRTLCFAGCQSVETRSTSQF